MGHLCAVCYLTITQITVINNVTKLTTISHGLLVSYQPQKQHQNVQTQVEP